ncbi:hypothetical protein EDB89DRAFT_1911525 [Lactarius sanguifluus]|nr:hypothetical protein EDB89DRAFT_1911525 [Lactarius sanguifluus]
MRVAPSLVIVLVLRKVPLAVSEPSGVSTRLSGSSGPRPVASAVGIRNTPPSGIVKGTEAGKGFATGRYKEGTTLNITTHADNVVPATVIPTTAIPTVIPATVPTAAIVFTTSPSQLSLVTAIPAVVVVTIAIFVARFVVALVVSQSHCWDLGQGGGDVIRVGGDSWGPGASCRNDQAQQWGSGG